MRQGYLCQTLAGRIVIDLAAFYHAAVTVAGEFAKANIRNDQKLRRRLLDFPNCPLDDAVLGPGFRADFIFTARQAEKQHGRYPQQRHLGSLCSNRVRRKVIAARHRLDRLLNPLALADE